MPEFRYDALDTQGQARSGRIRADDNASARADLMARGLFATRLALDTAGAANEVQAATAPGRRRIGARQLTMFTRQLATLAEVAPLEEALRTIMRQAESAAVQQVLARVHGGVVEGRPLSDAMKLEARSFPPLYRAMVAAGESAGTLPQILERLSILLERQAQVRARVTAALAYPAALAVVALLAVAGLMIFVVPRIAQQFDDIGQTLPLLTRMVIGASALLANFWWLILIIGAGLAMLFARAMRDEDFRLRFDTRLLGLPLLGRLLRDLNAARLARTLAMMVASRLPIIEGLQLTIPTIGNRALRAATAGMAETIREGGSLSSALRQTSVFPPILVYMAAGGESAGRLDMMLERAADTLEREFDGFTAGALALLEPAIILIMGGMVALIVLSILLPILQLETLASS
ncbi:type II secretion system inner membrane protein GspF [Sandarakinorhabdus sp.]|uniref:type II secretion system inner membrane protein GspF n=1 Tax=Sandarakinorhabdus sp. TaxID=1916663 RepID=UPI00286E2F64|nr:type II secretion system inner membrane protein GspF [Sandarakinorhabdus sp.]